MRFAIFERTMVMGLILALGLAGLAVAQDDPRESTNEAIDTRQASQQKNENWSAEKSALVARYRAAKANVSWLQDRQSEERNRVTAIEERIAELGRRLDESDRLERSMQDTLMVIFDRLEDNVATSLPFLPTERQLRLESLAGELVRPDVASGEKLRRLLEALQVEASYGASVEVYQGVITLDGVELNTDILRLGRVALFWRTPDGGRVGTYDQASGQWAELSGGENRVISMAMEMATRQRPMEIIAMPLGRINP
ncbi:MAG: hypothetical protein ACI9UK_000994 [Candidatus Krumholzibacteriia bacterium]|jgi:hypothetical protein